MKQLDWDIYFLKIAKTVAENSKCLSRKIGAVLVKDKAIISTGYNGPARGVLHCNQRPLEFYSKLDDLNNGGDGSRVTGKWFMDGDNSYPVKCPRKYFDYTSGQGLHLCQAGHAERNALIQAAKNGISTEGSTLYCYCPQVCKDCAIEIINAGVSRLVFLKGKDYDNYSKVILKDANIKITIIGD